MCTCNKLVSARMTHNQYFPLDQNYMYNIVQHDFFLFFLPLDALASSVYFKVMSIFCWQRLLLHKFRYKIYSINVRPKRNQYVHVNKIEIYTFRNQLGQVQKHIWNLIILVDHSIET